MTLNRHIKYHVRAISLNILLPCNCVLVKWKQYGNNFRVWAKLNYMNSLFHWQNSSNCNSLQTLTSGAMYHFRKLELTTLLVFFLSKTRGINPTLMATSLHAEALHNKQGNRNRSFHQSSTCDNISWIWSYRSFQPLLYWNNSCNDTNSLGFPRLAPGGSDERCCKRNWTLRHLVDPTLIRDRTFQGFRVS